MQADPPGSAGGSSPVAASERRLVRSLILFTTNWLKPAHRLPARLADQWKRSAGKAKVVGPAARAETVRCTAGRLGSTLDRTSRR